MGEHSPLGNKNTKQIVSHTDDVEEVLQDIEDKLGSLIGFEIPAHDEIDITYVASGNGAGEIATVVYSDNGTPVATLTLSYNSDNKLSNVVRS